MTPRRANARGRGNHRLDGDRIEDCTTPPRRPSIRVNLLRAHGSPTRYLYQNKNGGCRCAACCGQRTASGVAYRAAHSEEKSAYDATYRANHREEKRANNAAYTAAHRDEIATYNAAYRDEKTAYNAAYRVDHLEQEVAHHAAYYAAHHEAAIAYAFAYRASHHEEKTAYNAAYTAAHREETRARKLEREYGLLPGEWDAMFAAQGNVCAICGATEPGGKGAWHTDHDHNTGLTRGLLCHHCNIGLGNFRDDPERLTAAIEYLARAT